ncbi:Methyltransferase domain-containing protein [Pseudovibrio ascidiaceicola]|uniref:site-specific DNA-methyltransferase (adenine-specific) n=1 Tax=Pseudovibrio ascidiaceicola TaxID=285279 RepID=A0A1I4CN04_9HYPH|nr:DNA methyltransferase [Pseudovibrio ascidiaceicola]SFK82040.1 Methyltransferase domain-containing protein [Pseudovibrio ascidiaceicola]
MIDLWLKHVRQEGLVVSQSALAAENLVPIKQTAEDTETFLQNAHDFWSLAANVLGWPQERVLKGSRKPTDAVFRLTEMNVTLEADAALAGSGGEGVRLLVKHLANDIDPDARTSLGQWSGVSEQQAFERHLRESGILQGLLVTDDALRLTYSPSGETPGYLEWPIEGLKTTAGREMLAGLKLLLGRNAIWGSKEARLDGILKRSRESQNIVSTKLADQVLGALYTLLRGFTSEVETDHQLRDVAETAPQQFYEGLLTVLMRLVFVLYAEDRDLMPSSEDEKAKTIYEQGYAVRRLFVDLEADAALYPDTMADRYGAWGRLLGLFQLIYDGAGPSFMHQRRGKLFDLTTFPFLLGQFDEGDDPDVLPVSDKCIHEVLKQLLMLGGERLSYKTLDVEQIGSVYETVMGFTVTRSKGSSIALRSGKGGIPAYIDLEAVLGKAPDKRAKYFLDTIDFKTTPAQTKLLKTSKTIDEILTALDKKIDVRGSPDKRVVTAGTIILQPTDERRKTGSHYTPRSLTAPIVKEALEPVLAQLGDNPTPDQVLDLKVCDPAMGSGAFLVETCRALGEQLEAAWARHPELLPDEARIDPQVFARREVAKRCLYGVDKNHMATDLAKLSLWLVTLAKDEDFSFLDHALKTGDSLVGLTFDQLAEFDWQTDGTYPVFTQEFRRKVDAARGDRQRIRTAPDNVTFEQQKHRLDEADRDIAEVRLGGDAVIAVFFSEAKAKARRQALDDFQVQFGQEDGQDVSRRLQQGLFSGNYPITPFHWDIEFPEVFAGDNPGFDSIVGNPPFAGKNTIINGSRSGFMDWLKIISPGAHGNADLSAHFFRRAFALLREGGTMGLIATNTIGQGDTRESGLRYLLQVKNGEIYNARRRVKWPGEAAVVVSTVHVSKGPAKGVSVLLDGRSVSRVSAFVREGDFDETPAVLEENQNTAFQGSVILGQGFTFDDENAEKGKATNIDRMKELIAKNPLNYERIKPYLGGNEVNNDAEHRHRRYVIDFEDFPLRRDRSLKHWTDANEAEKKEMIRLGIVPSDYSEAVAEDWPDLLEIVETLVKPERAGNPQWDRREIWWRFTRRTNSLYDSIGAKTSVFAVNCGATPHLSVAKLPASSIWGHSLVIFSSDEFSLFCNLQSRIHEIWVRLTSSSMKDDLRYTSTDGYQTFPFPFAKTETLKAKGAEYENLRREIMKKAAIGLTELYNRFHSPLDRKPDIVELRRLHSEMDDAVLHAYGWDDLADLAQDTSEDGAAPRFLHRTDEPEFAYQERYHWPAWFRDKVLARLLELNRQRAAEEAKEPQNDKMKPSALQLDQQGTLI